MRSCPFWVCPLRVPISGLLGGGEEEGGPEEVTERHFFYTELTVKADSFVKVMESP